MTPTPTGEEIEEHYLAPIEAVHRRNCGTGRKYCYWSAAWTARLFRIFVVEEGIPGHWPITEDFFMGTDLECQVKADSLNRRRLDILPQTAAVIVASSMVAEDRNRR